MLDAALTVAGDEQTGSARMLFTFGQSDAKHEWKVGARAA